MTTARRRADAVAFKRSDTAVSAIEFAIVFPILLLLMLGGIQLVGYINATRKVDLIAGSISQMISQATPPAGSTTASVNATDLHFAYDAAIVLFPYLLKDGPRQGLAWWQDITIDFAGIQFTQIQSNCNNPNDLSACYVANVAWTSAGTVGNNYRLCGIPQSPAANNATPTKYTLPKSIFGPSSIIAIDVIFKFQPTFGSAVLKPFTINRSMFLPPRYASIITYDTTNSDGIAIKCPGY